MVDENKIRISQKMIDIALTAGNKIIHADYFAGLDQFVAEM
jgi:hypothetical protein